MTGALSSALTSVDWSGNINNLLAELSLVEGIEGANLRIAVWANQLEKIESKSPAIGFIREMQHAGHNVACLLALGLYKPAAASMRASVECALYFTYFKSHTVELGSLIRDPSFHVTKSEIIDFHRQHTSEFLQRQGQLNLVGRLAAWYSKTSAIVHGQVPGVWSYASAVNGIKYEATIARLAVDHFVAASSLVQDIFLCCLAQEHWKFFESDMKAFVVKGMSGATKEALKLDSA